jgi:isoleucyl-tRNA synthetase
LIDKDVVDVQRKLAMIWNMYDFFTLYADVDGWEWDGKTGDPSGELTNPLDVWIVSRLHQLCNHVDRHMQAYNIPDAVADILPFVDDASNWYVRRSRKRFWKSEDDTDKNDAYRTLHYVLVQLSKVMAPFTPFLSEELYRKLTDGESVHLLDWPSPGNIDEQLVKDMASVRTSITEGLALRAQASIKVRQPLASVTVPEVPESYTEIIAEELNVKEVRWGKELALDLEITPELKREGVMREVVRQVQNARKAAELQVDDRISLVLSTDDEELMDTIKEHGSVISQETLASSLDYSGQGSFEQTVKVENLELTIKLSKVE